MSIKGVDIASHQGPDFPFGRAAAEGYEFVIVKASGGHSYKNEYLGDQLLGAGAAGMEIAYYHYMFEPTVGGGDVEREFANFRDAISPYVERGETLWLDVEEYPASVGFTGDLGGWIDRFCTLVEEEFGRPCGIYCATWYLTATGLDKDTRLAKWPFWIASWQASPPAGSSLLPWSEITVWQNNALATVGGRRPIDTDVFSGERADWRILGGLTADPPPPPPLPAEPGAVSWYLNGKGQLIVEINFGGVATSIEGVNIQDAGGSVRNAAGEIYDRSLKANAFEPWTKRP